MILLQIYEKNINTNKSYTNYFWGGDSSSRFHAIRNGAQRHEKSHLMFSDCQCESLLLSTTNDDVIPSRAERNEGSLKQQQVKIINTLSYSY